MICWDRGKVESGDSLSSESIPRAIVSVDGWIEFESCALVGFSLGGLIVQDFF
ncbi:MAG: hypothetical protein Ct9H300mP21_00910 [Pseudomonadota bacterium]|nr:MAG: hypothetical protein Ct9H300mP21_00910 [Pseudomonadota bacterium]